VPEDQQFDVLGAAVAGELVSICRICRSSWYASEALMARIVTAKARRTTDHLAHR
jgi:hypothetical protein